MTNAPPTYGAARWGPRILVVLTVAVAAPIAISLLYAYPPTEYAFLPCLFNRFTGLHCPGCGSTRCCHSLLHGDLEQALAWNPLFVILLPVLIYATGRGLYRSWTGRRMAGYRFPMWMTHVLMWTIAIYWIVRNIPVAPFTYLAPHEVVERWFS
jgi:hypothetical protein